MVYFMFRSFLFGWQNIPITSENGGVQSTDAVVTDNCDFMRGELLLFDNIIVKCLGILHHQ
jgi:hypothetical protein